MSGLYERERVGHTIAFVRSGAAAVAFYADNKSKRKTGSCSNLIQKKLLLLMFDATLWGFCVLAPPRVIEPF
jgi:hypothetical protein